MDCTVNLSTPKLIELSLERGEGKLSNTGSLSVFTGARTGRSAKDKAIVHNSATEDTVAWGDVNRPVSQNTFDSLFSRLERYLEEQKPYVFEGYAGVRPEHAKDFRIVCELASQALFISQLLHQGNILEDKPFQILVAPGFSCEPERDGTRSDAAIMIDYLNRRALIAGTRYAGEIKKTVFSIMNFLLPAEGVLPMHC